MNPFNYNVPIKLNYIAALNNAREQRALWQESYLITEAEEDFKQFVYYDNLINWILERTKR